MSELGRIETDEKASKPFGKRIIGLENPENMSREQFLNSQELLFHGSREPIEYNPKFVYDKDFYSTQDGSLTLGTGFYTTPDKEQAENYSFVRQAGTEKETLHTISLLPKNAEMLDLRDKTNSEFNSFLPREIFEKWREKFVRYYKSQDRSKLPWYEEKFETTYLQHLDKLAEYPNVDLRSMLWTGADKNVPDGWYPSPPWVELFSDFMRDEGYDGVIYIEGGEGEKNKAAPTFCFFNTEVIDTYEGWQKRRQKGL